MSTPLIIVLLVAGVVVVGIFVLLGQFAVAVGLGMWRLVSWMPVRALTHVVSERLALRRSLQIILAVCQGALAGWIVYLCSFALMNWSIATTLAHTVLILASTGVMFPIVLLLRACEVAQNRAIKLESATPGPIVLFLRGFATEQAFHDDTGFFLGLVAESEEEEVSRYFEGAELGEVVGLAKPGQRFQELGATRLEIGTENWRAAVANLMRRANAIVMRLGSTDALVWELEEIVRAGKLSRTLFILPAAMDREGVGEEYAQLALRVAGQPGLPQLPTVLDPATRFLYFDSRGVAWIVTEDKKSNNSMAQLLSPFFKQLGVTNISAPTTHTNFVGRIVLAFVLLFIVVVYVLPRLAS
jgi:hypothetical protein